jgi:hypothetical protein
VHPHLQRQHYTFIALNSRREERQMNRQPPQIDFQELKQKLEEIDEFLKQLLWEEMRKQAQKEVNQNDE